MIEKKETRLRRARASRARIALQKTERLTVNRTNVHIYAASSADGGKVIVSASTVEPEVRTQLASAKGRGGNVNAAKIVGTRIAQKAKAAGIESVAFDRAGIDSMAGSRRWRMPRAKPV